MSFFQRYLTKPYNIQCSTLQNFTKFNYKCLQGPLRFLLKSKRQSHTTGKHLFFLTLVEMTEIIHVMYGQKLKCVPLSPNSFVNIANLEKPVLEQLCIVEDWL